MFQPEDEKKPNKKTRKEKQATQIKGRKRKHTHTGSFYTRGGLGMGVERRIRPRGIGHLSQLPREGKPRKPSHPAGAGRSALGFGGKDWGKLSVYVLFVLGSRHTF